MSSLRETALSLAQKIESNYPGLTRLHRSGLAQKIEYQSRTKIMAMAPNAALACEIAKKTK